MSYLAITQRSARQLEVEEKLTLLPLTYLLQFGWVLHAVWSGFTPDSDKIFLTATDWGDAEMLMPFNLPPFRAIIYMQLSEIFANNVWNTHSNRWLCKHLSTSYLFFELLFLVHLPSDFYSWIRLLSFFLDTVQVTLRPCITNRRHQLAIFLPEYNTLSHRLSDQSHSPLINMEN